MSQKTTFTFFAPSTTSAIRPGRTEKTVIKNSHKCHQAFQASLNTHANGTLNTIILLRYERNVDNGRKWREKQQDELTTPATQINNENYVQKAGHLIKTKRSSEPYLLSGVKISMI